MTLLAPEVPVALAADDVVVDELDPVEDPEEEVEVEVIVVASDVAAELTVELETASTVLLAGAVDAGGTLVSAKKTKEGSRG